MERRNFLKIAATGAGGMMLLPNFLAAAKSPLLQSVDSDEVLVFIQLNGGNDGLNTFVPFEDPLYYEYRQNIGISPDKLINKTNGIGFHPALKNLAQIQQEGNFSLIQNVGYPNPNRSHFRSQEIWQTATDSDKYLTKGWLGRFLEIQCADEHLAAVNVDPIDNLALKSDTLNGITIKDMNRLNRFAELEANQVLSENPQLDFARKVAFSSVEGLDDIQKALKIAKNSSVTYANSELSKNLNWIARLIKGNLNSKVYYTSFSGFDTHNNQIGLQNRQLTVLNDAVSAFYNDLKNENLLDRVTVVVFSEFGRRVKDNGSGTDHGTAGPMMIIGGKNKGLMLGGNPDLANLDKGDLIHKVDFRSVYATLLAEKFGFDATKISLNQPKLTSLF